MWKLALALFSVILLCVFIGGCTSVTTTPASNAWMEAYIDALISADEQFNYYMSLMLMDVDFDGTPELFLGYMSTKTMFIEHGFSYKNGAIVNIAIENSLGPQIEAYRNKHTGEILWLAGSRLPTMAGAEHQYRWNRIDFRNLSNVTTTYFFGLDRTDGRD